MRPGTIVFVAAGVPHRFHEIEERLVLFVAFRSGRGSAGLAGHGRTGTPVRDRGRQLERELRAAPDLVVAEEH